jgi:RNA polymerase sigma-70 factor, ECF subfamily
MGRHDELAGLGDAELASRAGAGDRPAFEVLARRWWDRLRRLAASGTGLDPVAAEEAAQDALVRIYEALPRFRGEAAFGTFAWRICRNAVCDSRRRTWREGRRREPAMVGSEGGWGSEGPPGTGANDDLGGLELADRARGPEEEALRADAVTALRSALAGLGAEERALIHLFEAEGLEIAELAVIFEVAEGTIKSRLHRTRARLGKALKEAGYGPS